MPIQSQPLTVPFDPLREAAKGRIKIVDRPEGGKEFILPALRNFGAKFSFSFVWLVMTGVLVAMFLMSADFVRDLPGWMRFLFINHAYYILGVVALIDLVLTLACLDLWLRSSRVIARKGELHVVTHWLFLKRVNTFAATKIIETRSENRTTVGKTCYYDIIVLTEGEKKSWLARNFPARRKPGSSFSENDLKAFNTGGKTLAIATGIEGKDEGDWLLTELRAALGISV